MRALYFYSLCFLFIALPSAVLAAESLDERLHAELRMINHFSQRLVSANEEFIDELKSERCIKNSTQGAADLNPSCKKQALQHLETLDENNRRSEEYMANMFRGWARVYGMLRVAHTQCGINSINFDLVPSSLRVQSTVILHDPDALLLEYIEASEGVLEQDLDDIDCDAIQSFTTTVQRIMIEMKRASEKMR